MVGNRCLRRIEETTDIKLLNFETEMLNEVYKKSPDKETKIHTMEKIIVIRKRLMDILLTGHPFNKK